MIRNISIRLLLGAFPPNILEIPVWPAEFCLKFDINSYLPTIGNNVCKPHIPLGLVRPKTDGVLNYNSLCTFQANLEIPGMHQT